MRMQVLAGIGLIVGSVVFLHAISAPIIVRVYQITDPVSRAAAVAADPAAWNSATSQMAAGGLVASVGLGLYALHLRRTQIGRLRRAALLAAIAAVLPLLVGVIDNLRTAAFGAEEVFSFIAIALGVVSVAFTLTALAIIGAIEVRLGNRPTGYGTLVFVAILVVLLVLLILPPLLIHYLFFILGVRLVVNGLRGWPKRPRPVTPSGEGLAPDLRD